MNQTSNDEGILKYLNPDDIVVPENVRSKMDEESLAGLTENVREIGVLEAIRVRQDAGKYVLWLGFRRLMAAKRAGLKKIPALVTGEVLDATEIRLPQLCENLHREDLSVCDQARAIREIMTAKNWTATQVARKLGYSNTKVSRLLAVLEWPEELQKRVDAGELPITAASELARLGSDVQGELTEQAVAGKITRDQLVGKRKATQRSTHESTTGVRRVTASLGNGRSVTVVAGQLNLEGLIDLLQELIEKARRVRSQGLELSTFLRVLRDTARSAT